MGISKNSGTPQIIHFNRVFHYFHHPFWGVYHPYFWKHPDGSWSNIPTAWLGNPSVVLTLNHRKVVGKTQFESWVFYSDSTLTSFITYPVAMKGPPFVDEFPFRRKRWYFHLHFWCDLLDQAGSLFIIYPSQLRPVQASEMFGEMCPAISCGQPFYKKRSIFMYFHCYVSLLEGHFYPVIFGAFLRLTRCDGLKHPDHPVVDAVLSNSPAWRENVGRILR